MPEPIASTFVEIKYDQVTKAQQAIDKMGVGFNKAASDIESKSQRISRAFGALGGVIAGIGIAKFGADIIGASTRMDSLNRSLITTEGSVQKANARMKEFVQIAKDPGLGLTQLAKGYIQLKSVNIEADLAIKSIRGIANAIALVGGGKEELERVTRQFVQMQGKGKVMAEDLVVIAESLPQIRKLAEQAFGTANTEALQKMGITGKQFLAGITAELEKMPKAADSAKNAQDNFTDALERFRAKLGDTILPTVTKFLNGLTDLMGKFEAMPASTQKALGTAVVGGAGLLGLAATLTSIATTIGLVKTGLSGIGAVNVGSAAASAGASVAGSAVATGVLNARGQMIMRTAESAGAGAAGASLLTKAGVVTVFIAGAAGAFWAGAKLGKAIFGKDYDSKGNIISSEKPLTDAESSKWQSMVDKFNTSYFGSSASTPSGVPRKTLSPSESIVGAVTPEQIKELQKLGMDLPTKADLAEKAKKDAEIYWTNWFDHAEAIAKQEYQIKTNQPSPIFMPNIPSRGVGNIGFNEIPSMAGGVPAISGLDINRKGLTSGLGLGLEVSKAAQESQKSIEAVFDIERYGFDKWQKNFNESASEMGKVQDSWNDLVEDMDYGIEDVGLRWAQTIQGTLSALNQGFALFEPILNKLGITDKSSSQAISSTLSGAASGAALGSLIFPGIGTAIGAGIGGLSGYLSAKGYAEGGWVMKPTIALMGEREPELVIPKSKLGQAGVGGASFGNVNINVMNPNVSIAEIKRNMLIALKELRAEGRI